MSGTGSPKRRKTDRGWRFLFRDNWYRDLWLLVITGFVYLAITNSQHAVDQIQQERAHNVLVSCEANNQRYDNTIRTLDALIKNSPPSERARAEASRASTVLLIQALAPPHEDRKGHSTCAAVVKQQVSVTQ